MKVVRELLQEEVVVLDVRPTQVVVLRVGKKVQAGSIQRIAVGLQQRAIVVAVHRELGMAMGVAAVNPVGLAARLDLIIPDSPHTLNFIRMQRVNRDLGLRSRAQLVTDQPSPL